MITPILTGTLARWIKPTAYLSVFFLLTGVAAGAVEHPWQLKKNVQGISVHTRPVDGSRVLEFKASVTVNAPLAAILPVFEDERRMTDWYHQCVRVDLVEEEGPLKKIFYFVLNMPWPVAQRDVVFRRAKSTDTRTGVISYELTALPERLPKKRGNIRVNYLKSVWRFTPLKNNQTEIYFQQHSRAPGSVPMFIANAMVVNVPFLSLKNLRQMVEQGTVAGIPKH